VRTEDTKPLWARQPPPCETGRHPSATAYSAATMRLVAEIHVNLDRMARRWHPPQPISQDRAPALDAALGLDWSETTFPAFFRELERREREGEP
jgi:hypothetical protein